jgi:serine/threonine-protein kinase RsbW
MVRLLKDKIELTLPNKPEFVSIARLTASVIANNMGFDIEDIEDIKVAIGEACNNSVIHGNKAAHIQMKFICEPNQFVAEIVDEGEGFDIEEYEKPDLDNYQGRGLGIFIMESLMDDVSIESMMGNGTRIRLIKEIQ